MSLNYNISENLFAITFQELKLRCSELSVKIQTDEIEFRAKVQLFSYQVDAAFEKKEVGCENVWDWKIITNNDILMTMGMIMNIMKMIMMIMKMIMMVAKMIMMITMIIIVVSCQAESERLSGRSERCSGRR